MQLGGHGHLSAMVSETTSYRAGALWGGVVEAEGGVCRGTEGLPVREQVDFCVSVKK